MSAKIWKRYYEYGCVSLSQEKFGEAARDFRKALMFAEKVGDKHLYQQSSHKLSMALRLAGCGTAQSNAGVCALSRAVVTRPAVYLPSPPPIVLGSTTPALAF